jgi:hypothetical protein
MSSDPWQTWSNLAVATIGVVLGVLAVAIGLRGLADGSVAFGLFLMLAGGLLIALVVAAVLGSARDSRRREDRRARPRPLRHG